MRRVIGGDDVQRTVLETIDKGMEVGLRPERRRHLEIAIEGAETSVGEGEMMRASLAGDADASLFGSSDQIDTPGRGDVEDMKPTSGKFRQFNVAVDHDFFGSCRHAAQAEAHALEPFVHDAPAR